MTYSTSFTCISPILNNAIYEIFVVSKDNADMPKRYIWNSKVKAHP